jgi:hypothetical protein
MTKAFHIYTQAQMGRILTKGLAAAAFCVLATGLLAIGFWERGTGGSPAGRVVERFVPSTTTSSVAPSTLPTTAPTVTTRPPATAPATVNTTTPPTPGSPPAAAPGALPGCPPTGHPPPAPPPWHPAVLVPESDLPTPPPPAPRVSDLSAIGGKGMWIWEYPRTEGGDVAAIVQRARASHLTELWVRVGSSRDGFYGAPFLDALVPAAHRSGLAVIGWGFAHLYDPAADAKWSQAALDWQASSGDRLDGWSPDIEAASEGTALSAKRASVYLGLIRPHAAGRPIIATVYQPTTYWLSVYPYRAMAPYVDAFAPMVYWGCREPGEAAAAAIAALTPLAPVHLIGQAYDMAPYGRIGAPGAAEISRFLSVAQRQGASGASFWVWQSMTTPEWNALSAYSWPGR